MSYYNTLDKICQSLEGGICKKIAEDKKEKERDMRKKAKKMKTSSEFETGFD